MAKEYVVIKDGEELKTYKSLPAAKALAEKEDAEVFCEGDCVYAPDPVVSAVVEDDSPLPHAETTNAVTEAPVEEKQVQQYTLTRKMNVREKPSLNANKLKVLDTGTVVDVEKVENDWLCLVGAGFILYEYGKNAKKK